VRRWEFVLGKFSGLVLLLVVTYAVMTVLFVPLTWLGMYTHFFDYRNVSPEYLEAFWQDYAWQTADQLSRGFLLSLLHTVTMAAVAVVVCVRLPMVLGVVVYFGVFVAGHLVQGVVRLVQGAGRVMVTVVEAVALAVPNLETFNVAHEVGLGQYIAWSDISACVGYTVVYSAAAVIVAVVLFRRREVF